ncbi:MAG: endonuclease [Pirellula sp.]|nr:endonuclease [Pirellula sp.]
MLRSVLRQLLTAQAIAAVSACWLALAFLATQTAAGGQSVRIATFNLSLYDQNGGEILARLQSGDDSQAQHLAEIIQRVRPEVILLNEIDDDPQGEVLRTFCEKYLAVPQNVSESPAGPAEPLDFAHRFRAPSNTGRHSGFDLGRNGAVDAEPNSDAYAADAWGYGRYHGQYGMAILSKFPIDEAAVRTFQNFRWRDMPDAKLPDDSATPAPHDWYSAEVLEQFPLSSKSHWDVPILVDGQRIHILASHPTPPTFDGPEDRNGRRNHDEIRFWGDYTGSPKQGDYIVDDKAQRGGLEATAPSSEPGRHTPGASFVILGDLNGDPQDGDGPAGISALLNAPQVLKYPPPASLGAVEQTRLQGGANARHRGDPAHDTCDPADNPGPGNLHIDYVLPSADLQVAKSGVFWPESTDPLFKLVGVHPFPSSDHRMVWVDVELLTAKDAKDAK